MVFDIYFVNYKNIPYGAHIHACDESLLPNLKSLLSDVDTISVRVHENTSSGRIIFSTANYEDTEGLLINCNTYDEFKLLNRIKEIKV